MGIEDRQEVKLLRKDGSSVWVLGSANPVFDGNGEYVGSLALLADLPAKRTGNTGCRRSSTICVRLAGTRVAPAVQRAAGALSGAVPDRRRGRRVRNLAGVHRGLDDRRVLRRPPATEAGAAEI